jgi:hypothetical protein
MLGTVVAAVAIGLGISMYADPNVYANNPAFSLVFLFASPYAWGTVYIVTAIAILIGVYTNQKYAQSPAFVMGATFGMHGLLVIPSIANGEIPSPLFLYMGFAWVCIITQVICGARKVRSEESPIRYQS